MLLYFKDRVRFGTQEQPKKSKKREAIDDHANIITWVGLSVYDCCVLGCMALNVSTKGSIASFETLGISMAESHFDMESSRAGTIVASCGTVGVFSLLCMGYFSRIFTDIQLICGGMLVMATGIVSLTTLDEVEANPSWRFIFAIFLIYSVGYPIGHTAVIGLFSKSKFVSVSIVPKMPALTTLTHHFLSNLCCSRRAASTGRASRMVCFRWITSQIDVSYHVGVHYKLCGYWNSLLGIDDNSCSIDRRFSVQSADSFLFVKLMLRQLK